MDADRFDALTRFLFEGSSRRRALGLSMTGILGMLGVADVFAKKRKKKCKKTCGPCRKCKKGKCKPKPNGTACGTCHICEGGQCVNTPDNTPCEDGNPCTVNTICTNGVCAGMPGNNGFICGNSTHGGTAIRCCDGACPDPICVPSGPTSDTCSIAADCSSLNCCSEEISECVTGSCRCYFAQANEPCGSDLDCSVGAGTSTACTCGQCKPPPV
jgi:hypothetical protein